MRFSSFVFASAVGAAFLFRPALGAAQAPPTPASPTPAPLTPAPPSAGFPLDDLQPTAPPAPSPSAPGATPTPTPSASSSAPDRRAEPTSPAYGAAVASTPATDPTAPGTSDAQFGDEGQWVFTSDLQVSINHHSGAEPTFNVFIEPDFSYFMAPGISVGVGLWVSHENRSETFTGYQGQPTLETTSTDYGVAFKLGGNVRLSELFSLWIQGFFGLYHEHDRVPHVTYFYTAPPAVSTISENETGCDIGVYAPVLLHPAKHFFIGMGPTLRYDHLFPEDASGTVTKDSVTVALSTTIGGWL